MSLHNNCISTTETAVATLPKQSGETIYNQTFWLAYVANVSLMCANALTFRFAELIAHLGGTEQIAGFVVSVGVIGTLVARFVLGQAIDRYGTRTLWTMSSVMFVAGCGMFLACKEPSWGIYGARIVFSVGLAGMHTCSFVHIQNQVPAHRRTEVIGSLGTSGFVGMIAGAQLGDWIFKALQDGRPQFLALFGGAAVLGLFYFIIVLYLTRHVVHQRPHETPAAHQLIFRYWPGSVALVAIMMGFSFTVTTVFLTRFATHLNLSGIGTFFTGYAVAAFIFRIFTGYWSKTRGRHWMILMGLGGHCVGHCMLPFVTQEWHFLIPSIACGFGHAMLFPAVISLGAGAFPKEYRGSGTTIVLGFADLGAALSAPILGRIIVYFDQVGFTPMFFTSSSIALLIGVVYALTTARQPDDDVTEEEQQVKGISTLDDEELSAQKSGEPVVLPLPHLGRSA